MCLTTSFHMWKEVKSEWAERQESFKASNKVKHSETISLVFCGLLAGGDINKIILKYNNNAVQTNLLQSIIYEGFKHMCHDN